MKPLRTPFVFWSIAAFFSVAAEAREWADSTGHYSLDANLVAFNDTTVVLQRADHKLVAMPIEKLSEQDHEYLNSKEVGAVARQILNGMQTWTLRDSSKVDGRIVDFARYDTTLQRRRGRIYVNNRVLENLPGAKSGGALAG